MSCSIVVRESQLQVGPCDHPNYLKACAAANMTPGIAGTYVAEVEHVMEVLAAFKRARIKLSPSKTFHFPLIARAEELERAHADATSLVETHGLYPYQADGVAFLRGRSRALLADDMGLGKTVQAAMAIPAEFRTLVVAPKVVLSSWVDEIRRWRPDLGPVIVTDLSWPCAPGRVHITNYERLKWDGAIPQYDLVIADEVHYLKSVSAKRTKMFRLVAERAPYVWGLSGTPMTSELGDLWGVLVALGIAQEAFGSRKHFETICNATRDDRGEIRWGTPTPAVAMGLSRVSLRRTKSEVLPQLPEKRDRVVSVELHVQDRGAVNIEAGHIPGGEGFEYHLDIEAPEPDNIHAARKALATAKFPALIDQVEQYEQSNEPLVVMSAHVNPMVMLALRDGWACITGRQSDSERSEAVRAFQAGELRGLACTIGAAGVGITLTRASNMVILDEVWNPGANDQARDRIHRIGQTRGCLYTYLVADHSLDQAVHAILKRKRQSIDDTVGRITTINPSKLATDLRMVAKMSRKESNA